MIQAQARFTTCQSLGIRCTIGSTVEVARHVKASVAPRHGGASLVFHTKNNEALLLHLVASMQLHAAHACTCEQPCMSGQSAGNI